MCILNKFERWIGEDLLKKMITPKRVKNMQDCTD